MHVSRKNCNEDLKKKKSLIHHTRIQKFQWFGTEFWYCKGGRFVKTGFLFWFGSPFIPTFICCFSRRWSKVVAGYCMSHRWITGELLITTNHGCTFDMTHAPISKFQRFHDGYCKVRNSASVILIGIRNYYCWFWACRKCILLEKCCTCLLERQKFTVVYLVVDDGRMEGGGGKVRWIFLGARWNCFAN